MNLVFWQKREQKSYENVTRVDARERIYIFTKKIYEIVQGYIFT